MPVPAIAILGTLATVGLVAAVSGKKKKQTSGAPPTYTPPSANVPATPGGSQATDWRKWIDGKVIEAAQSRSPELVERAAQEIDAASVNWAGDLKSIAMQASASLRAMAASLRGDNTRPADPPPYTSVPVNPPPPPAAGPVPNPPPIQMPPATDWNQWIQQTLVEAATSGIPESAENAASTIEQRIPSMPIEFQQRARDAANALRSQAANWRAVRSQQPPVYSPPVVVQPPAPAPRPPDPVLSAAAQLAQQMTTMLKNLDPGYPSQPNRNAEDKALVSLFQRQEGLTADGLYGVSSALQVPKYGIVPARPTHFSATPSKTATAKSQFKARMSEMASADPARASQWLAAAKIDNL